MRIENRTTEKKRRKEPENLVETCPGMSQWLDGSKSIYQYTGKTE
jgi:hypothetical protein